MENAFDSIDYADGNIPAMRDTLNAVLFRLSSPDRDTPSQPADNRPVLDEITQENFLDVLADIRTALISIGVAKEPL